MNPTQVKYDEAKDYYYVDAYFYNGRVLVRVTGETEDRVARLYETIAKAISESRS